MDQSKKTFLDKVEKLRLEAMRALPASVRAELGQFFTPQPIASFMASLFSRDLTHLKVLDPGAGTGILSAACVAELCLRDKPPKAIEITAFELDARLIEYLQVAFQFCGKFCEERGIQFFGNIVANDFIKSAVSQMRLGFFQKTSQFFDIAILNPPYRKISGESETRKLLNSVQLETTNLYSAFMWLCVRLLHENGELVAITPRSFCNGPYFKRFRQDFLRTMSLRHIHLFESRKSAFREDEVLQENIIIHALKDHKKPKTIFVSASQGPSFPNPSMKVGYSSIIRPGDQDSFIHIPTHEIDQSILERLSSLPATIDDLGVAVSTGRIVDFRSRKYLRLAPDQQTAPLIYPSNFSAGYVNWPKSPSKKANSIKLSPETELLLVPSGYYVLVKRFSSKEEARRIVAAVFDPNKISTKRIGFENHLNFFHSKANGLQPELARGLALFLNSTIVDRYFRQFNGHTQVNATDLRKLRYPSRNELIKLGSKIRDEFPSQEEINSLIEKEIFIHGQEESKTHSTK